METKKRLDLKNLIGIIVVSVIVITTFALSLWYFKSTKEQEEKQYYVYTIDLGNSFQTVSKVQIVSQDLSEEERQRLGEEMRAVLEELDLEFNAVERIGGEKSTLMKVNEKAGIEPVSVSGEFIYVLEKALEVASMSKVDGVALFDPTIAPVWQAWDFPELIFTTYEGPVPVEYLPTREELESLLPLVNYEKVVLDKTNNKVFLTEVGMALDLGSIVKGYAADKIKEYLVSQNIDRAIIDVGANILLLGNYVNTKGEDIDWPLYVRTPSKNYLAGDLNKLGKVLDNKDKTVVTSGDYEKYIIDEDGNHYHHILDPRTGYPIANGLVSVSIITDLSILGDAYSTTVFALGLEKGMEFIETTDNTEAVFVLKEGKNYKVYVSSGLENKFEFNASLEEKNYQYQGVYR